MQCSELPRWAITLDDKGISSAVFGHTDLVIKVDGVKPVTAAHGASVHMQQQPAWPSKACISWQTLHVRYGRKCKEASPAFAERRQRYLAPTDQ